MSHPTDAPPALPPRYQRADGLLAAPVSDELLMMSIEQGRYYSLNGVGTRIWDLLAEPRTLDDLVAALTAEYEVDADTARAEVATFLADLDARGLLR